MFTRIARIIGTVLCLSVVALVATGVIWTKSTQHQLMPVLTGSMTPVMPAGSLAVMHPVNSHGIHEGDIIAFKPPAAYNDPANPRTVLHRVASLQTIDNTPVIQTRGDANTVPDPWYLDQNTADVALVDTNIPYLGAVATWAKENVLGICICAGGLILVTTAITRLRRTRS